MKLRYILLIIINLIFAALLPAQMNPPAVGIVRFTQGNLYPVLGLPASLVIGKVLLRSVEAASFSDKAGLVSVAGQIRLLNSDGSVLATYDTHGSMPVLDVEDSVHGFPRAIAWLPAQSVIVFWNGTDWITTELVGFGDEDVVSIRADTQDSAELIVRAPDTSLSRVHVSLENGNLLSSELLAGVERSAIQLGPSLIHLRDKEIEIVDPGNRTNAIPFPANDVITWQRMSSHSVHIYSASEKRDWVLQRHHSEWQLSELPGEPTK